MNEWRMSEDELQVKILKEAKKCGWLRMHVRPARMQSGRWSTPTQGDQGYPDLTLAHPQHGLVLVELKDARGRLSPGQERWRDVLQSADASWSLWRPEDWRSGLIRGLLDPSSTSDTEEAS